MCFPFHKGKTRDNLSFKCKKTAWNCHLSAQQTTICFCSRRWEESAVVRSLLLHHMGNVQTGCIWSNNKFHTNVSANVKLLVTFWHRAQAVITISAASAVKCHGSGSHMLTAGLCTSPRDSKSRLRSRLTFVDLVIFIWLYQISTTGLLAESHHMDGEWNCDSHTIEEKYGPLSRPAAAWKKPRKPLCCSWLLLSLTDETPHSIALFPSCVALSRSVDIYAQENYYFSISRSTHTHKKRERGIPHLARPTHLFLTLFLPTLLSTFVSYSPPPLQPLIPPQIPSPLSPPLSFFLIPSPVFLSPSGSHVCVQAGLLAVQN